MTIYYKRFLLCILIATTPVAPVIADAEFAHEYLNLDLPTGWSSETLPADSAETIGKLKSSAIEGASIILNCYRGMLHTQASSRIRGLNTLAAILPGGQEQLSKPKKIKTSKGKGAIEFWRGFVPAGENLMVTLATPMAVVKTKHCWLVAIGIGADTARTELETDFETIIKTAR